MRRTLTLKKNQNNRIEIICSRLTNCTKLIGFTLNRWFCWFWLWFYVCFGFRVLFFWVPPQHWKRRRRWAHAACFALPRWLTVHDNAPRATNALATMPAMWNLRTQQRPRNTLPRQQQQLTLGSTFDVRSMSAVAVAQRRRHCDEATHQEGALNTEAQKVGEWHVA